MESYQEFMSPSILESVLQAIGRCDLLPFRFRKKLIRRFFDYEKISTRPFQIDFHGLLFTGDLSSFIDWSVFFFGAYEKYVLGFMNAFARIHPDCKFIDVGANIGHHSLFMSRFASSIHAIEPWKEAAKTMAKQLARNRVSNVIIHDNALGAENTTAKYYPPTGSNRGVGSFLESFSGENAAQTFERPIQCGDEFIGRNVGHFDLIKIDTEGYEYFVIKGLQASIARYRPCVIMELSHNTSEGFSTLQSLRNEFPNDYRFFGLTSVHSSYHFRLCELTSYNWRKFIDVVAITDEEAGVFASRIRDWPFYSKPTDLFRMAKSYLTRNLVAI
jgi:FkbM family methyltransferase